MIRLVAFDIDGILTDGAVLVDGSGREQKRIHLRDVDAVFELKRRGYALAAVTGEAGEIVDYFEKRFPWDYFYRGMKKKGEALREIEEKAGIAAEEICYIGDGRYDAGPLAAAGLGVCPARCAPEAERNADIVLKSRSGEGCVEELAEILSLCRDAREARRLFGGGRKQALWGELPDMAQAGPEEAAALAGCLREIAGALRRRREEGRSPEEAWPDLPVRLSLEQVQKSERLLAVFCEELSKYSEKHLQKNTGEAVRL